MDTKTADNRIGQLEDKLKQRDRTILELRQEAEEAQALIAELREQVQDVGDIIDSWIEAFDMELGDDGIWNFSRYDADRDAEHEAYVTLVRKWNKLVPRYNAVITANGLGRPLLASEAQQRDVRKLHKSGKSLRTIVTATGLSFRTVRTIVGRVEGTDRTTRRTNELRRLKLNASRMAAYRVRKRTRDALPQRITEALARGKSLVKRAR